MLFAGEGPRMVGIELSISIQQCSDLFLRPGTNKPTFSDRFFHNDNEVLNPFAEILDPRPSDSRPSEKTTVAEG